MTPYTNRWFGNELLQVVVSRDIDNKLMAYYIAADGYRKGWEPLPGDYPIDGDPVMTAGTDRVDVICRLRGGALGYWQYARNVEVGYHVWSFENLGGYIPT